MGLRNGILIRIRKKHIRIGNKFDCVEGVIIDFHNCLHELFLVYSCFLKKEKEITAGSGHSLDLSFEGRCPRKENVPRTHLWVCGVSCSQSNCDWVKSAKTSPHDSLAASGCSFALPEPRSCRFPVQIFARLR